MYPYFLPIPLGAPLPLNNPHAISVSLPTMHDVIGYEENKAEVKDQMLSGYPRFFTNKLVEKLCIYVRENNRISEDLEIIPLMSVRSYEIINRHFNSSFEFINLSDCIFLLVEKSHQQLIAIKDFIRHTGIQLSSRKAEDVLFNLNLISEKRIEKIHEFSIAPNIIKANLGKAYQTELVENILLCSSGMNAIYAVFNAIIQKNKNTKKQAIIQAGSLYLDSSEIIRKFSKKSVVFIGITDLTKLKQFIIGSHAEIGAVFTEIPNNPLIECVDLPELYIICQQFSIPLIVDGTIGTAYNLNILKYCDIAVESLTKFACGRGEIMMGAIIPNPKSILAEKIFNFIQPNIVEPYSRDMERLSINIENYESRVQAISKNTKIIYSYLKESTAVKQIYSVFHEKSYQNFLKIRRNPDAIPGLISVVFDRDLSFYYDKLNFPKGPSLGTEFTLAMPYVYLAHYDLTKTESGRTELQKMGLHPDLLRISIGIEPIEDIIHELKSAGI